MNIYKIQILIIALIVFCQGCKGESATVELSETTRKCAEVVSESEGSVYVYITGEVKKEGVYSVLPDTRLYQVIEQAGGFTKNAYKSDLNLVEQVSDGQKIQVLSKKEYKEQMRKSEASSVVSDIDSEMVNINTAGVEQLTKLSGIGNTKAEAIIAFRQEYGNFSSVEELKNVSGIGEATFAQIQSMITVN